MKRIGIIAGVVTCAAIIGITAGLLLSRSSHDSVFDEDTSLSENSLVKRASANIAASAPTTRDGLVELPIRDIEAPVRGGGQLYFYEPRTGELSSLDLQTNVTTSLKSIPRGAIRIAWAPNRHGVIAYYFDHATYHSLTDEQSVEYDAHISSPTFLDSDNIVYVYTSPNSGLANLSIAYTDLSSFKNILPTRLQSWIFHPLGNDMVAMIDMRPGDTRHSLTILNLSNGELNTLLSNLEALEVQPSPDATKALYSYIHPRSGKVELHLLDLKKKTTTPLHIGTLASKCTWTLDGIAVYCGVPITAPTTDTYRETSRDSLIQFTLNNTDVVQTLLEDSALDITEPTFGDPTLLILPNERDGKVYSFRIN